MAAKRSLKLYVAMVLLGVAVVGILTGQWLHQEWANSSCYPDWCIFKSRPLPHPAAAYIPAAAFAAAGIVKLFFSDIQARTKWVILAVSLMLAGLALYRAADVAWWASPVRCAPDGSPLGGCAIFREAIYKWWYALPMAALAGGLVSAFIGLIRGRRH